MDHDARPLDVSRHQRWYQCCTCEVSWFGTATGCWSCGSDQIEPHHKAFMNDPWRSDPADSPASGSRLPTADNPANERTPS